MVNERVKALIGGLMEESTSVNGRQDNSTASVSPLVQMERKRMESGRTVLRSRKSTSMKMLIEKGD